MDIITGWLYPFMNGLWDLDDEWRNRWFFLFNLPLSIGLLAGLFVLVSNVESKARPIDEEQVEVSADIAGKLTYIGAILTGLVNLNSYLTTSRPTGAGINGNDIAVLFAANVVFAAIASSHLLFSKLHDTLARSVIAAGIVASIGSIFAMIVRVPDEVNFPDFVRETFLWMLAAAALIIFSYVRGRVGWLAKLVIKITSLLHKAVASTRRKLRDKEEKRREKTKDPKPPTAEEVEAAPEASKAR